MLGIRHDDPFLLASIALHLTPGLDTFYISRAAAAKATRPRAETGTAAARLKLARATVDDPTFLVLS